MDPPTYLPDNHLTKSKCTDLISKHRCMVKYTIQTLGYSSQALAPVVIIKLFNGFIPSICAHSVPLYVSVCFIKEAQWMDA